MTNSLGRHGLLVAQLAVAVHLTHKTRKFGDPQGSRPRGRANLFQYAV